MLVSGFLIARDLIEQGYPVLEAIVSALPLCDELLISEGFSGDETWEALCALQEIYPEKIRLFRDAWHGPTERGEVIAHMTNVVRLRARGRYCFSLQANEILPEGLAAAMRGWPDLHPRQEMFAIRYEQVIGPALLWKQTWRGRFFRNRPYLVSRGDGASCGRDPWLRLTHPMSFLRRGRVLYQNTDVPIRRYRVLFPDCYGARMAGQARVFTEPSLRDQTERERRHAEAALQRMERTRAGYDGFWREMAPYFDTRGRDPVPTRVAATVAPLIAPLVGDWSYDWRKSIARL